MKAIRRDSRPALILWGEHDFVFSRALAEWVAGALRRERPVMLAGAGHFAPEDQGEAIAGLIADWLG
jgi:pimeloyl-ACP methyl ester carboxylesterase